MCPIDERILVLAPIGQDATLIVDQLQTLGLQGAVCRDLSELARSVMEGAASALIAEEALHKEGLGELIEALGAQPGWSDLPITVLTTSEFYATPGDGQLLRKLADAGNVVLLERPSKIVTLVTTVQAAVRTRRRQYEFRHYLQQYERYQEQVRQTQKLESLGVLAGGIAHDFNNILTGILGNATLVAELLPPGHPAHRLIEDVVKASERAASLTNQMLAYAGKGQFVIRSVDLSALIGGLTDFFRASVPKNVELSLYLGRDLPHIEADASQLEQVIMNLVLNAAEAIPQGIAGRVRVMTSVQDIDAQSAGISFLGPAPPYGKYSAVQVVDDGDGMDEQTLAKIFDPFFTTKFMGRGLGLAAVQGIVRRHGGWMNVQSRPGQGTTFTVLFPASAAETELADESVRRNKDIAGTVLVVDDEDIVRRTATSLLEQQGFRVSCAENGKVAVDLFRRMSDEISVVLLDVTMPVMDGEETLRELKAIRPDTKVLLSSGFNEADVVRRFAAADLAGFIQKPYSSTRLVDKIRRVLDAGEIPRAGHS
ncbi:MAG: response regulator [Bryobacteraceae bacterium]